jgi:stress response protein YsnF
VGGRLPDEIVLHTERPVVTVEVVPTERVRLRTQVVEGQETVTEQVQREQIVVDQEAAAQGNAGQGTAPRSAVDQGTAPGRV